MIAPPTSSAELQARRQGDPRETNQVKTNRRERRLPGVLARHPSTRLQDPPMLRAASARPGGGWTSPAGPGLSGSTATRPPAGCAGERLLTGRPGPSLAPALPRRPAGTRRESRSRSSAERRWLHLGWSGSGSAEPTAEPASSFSEPIAGSAQPAAGCEQGTAASQSSALSCRRQGPAPLGTGPVLLHRFPAVALQDSARVRRRQPLHEGRSQL
jgi:hypothetical protein